MNKQDFLAELRQRLGGVDETTRGEVCADIEYHFAEGTAQGYTEDEICRNLGSPASIAEQLMEAMPKDEKPMDRPPHRQYNPGNLAGSAPARPQSAVAQGQSAFKTILGSLTSSYDIDIDQTFTGVSDIDIKLASNHLTICKAPEQTDAVRVTIQGTSRYNDFRLEQTGGALTVHENTPWFKFEIFFVSAKLETVVYIPSSFNGNIRAKNSNGKINVYNVNGYTCDVHSSAGNVAAEQCTFYSFGARASAGNLSAKRINANYIKINSAAGNVEAEDTLGELDAQSSAGNVRVHRHEGNFMRVNALAGKAEVTNSSCDIDAHSSAGSVVIDCAAMALGNVRADSPAGSVKLYAMETGKLKLDSAAGSVKVKIGKLNGNAELSASAGTVHFEAREINANLYANSSMGSVKLKLPNPCDCRIQTSAAMGGVKNSVTYNKDGVYTIKADSNLGSVKIEPVV